jgi:hypothetical protein
MVAAVTRKLLDMGKEAEQEALQRSAGAGGGDQGVAAVRHLYASPCHGGRRHSRAVRHGVYAGEKMRVGVVVSKLKVIGSFFTSLISLPRLFFPMPRLIQFLSYCNFIPEYFWVVLIPSISNSSFFLFLCSGQHWGGGQRLINQRSR